MNDATEYTVTNLITDTLLSKAVVLHRAAASPRDLNETTRGDERGYRTGE